MIILDQLTKVVGARNLLSSVSIKIPSDRRIALIGSDDKDKQVLIGLLAGAVMPTAGRVVRKAEISFLVGQLPGFSKEFSVRLNVAHVARLYGANVRQTLEVVETALEMGSAFDKPYDELPRDLRRPLAQVVAFAIPFDVYMLSDDKLRPAEKDPPSRGHRKDHSATCFALFQARLQSSGMIIPTSDLAFAKEYCDMGMVLQRGRLHLVDDVGEAFELESKARRDQVQRRRARRKAQT